VANIPLVSLLFFDISLQSLNSIVFIPTSKISISISKQPNITIIGTVAFLQASKLLGSSNFKLHFLDIQVNFAKLAEAPVLSNIPFKYHKFVNIFSKTKAEVLAPHYSYDLQINLKQGVQPLVGLIYSLSASKQEAFKEFIEENLNMGFI